MAKTIYILKWMPHGTVPKDNPAYTDKERAHRHMEHANKNRKWYHHIAGGQWIVSTLILHEGRRKVHNV